MHVRLLYSLRPGPNPRLVSIHRRGPVLLGERCGLEPESSLQPTQRKLGGSVDVTTNTHYERLCLVRKDEAEPMRLGIEI